VGVVMQDCNLILGDRRRPCVKNKTREKEEKKKKTKPNLYLYLEDSKSSFWQQ
jgi:hypothetical protein